METIAPPDNTVAGRQPRTSLHPPLPRMPSPQEEGRRSHELFHGFVGTPADDQLRLVQQALAQLRESVVITTKDLDEPGPLIVYANQAFTRITGWKPEELIGKSPRILQGPRTTRKTLDRLRAQLAKGEAFEGEDINYRKDGTEFNIDWYIEPLRDVKGQINYWVAVQRDVTERNELQAQLLRAQRLEGIGLLASGIAHDLNNVLAPVMLGCEVLRDYIVDQDAMKFLGLLDDSAKRGAGLVRQILSFARGITGATALIDPRHLMHEIATMAKATFPKTIRIVEEAAANVGTVEADATQLHQVLLNLCINARDAIAEEGTITLSASKVQSTEVLHTAREELAPGNYMLLSVSDTGSGMPPEVAAKIFDPFFSTKAPDKGTGLGLSTVAMIVKNLRGGIALRSSPGQGTTFSIYLPLAEATATETGEADSQSVRNGNGRSVLIADDEVAVAEIMKETLEAAGYKVTLAHDGIQALAVAGDAQPEIAVIDLLMPRSGGLATMRELRARFPQLRIVAISGLSASETEKSADGAEAVLQKPFTLHKLLRAVGGSITGRCPEPGFLTTVTQMARIGKSEIQNSLPRITRIAQIVPELVSQILPRLHSRAPAYFPLPERLSTVCIRVIRG